MTNVSYNTHDICIAFVFFTSIINMNSKHSHIVFGGGGGGCNGGGDDGVWYFLLLS